jgi:hypothetical protein
MKRSGLGWYIAVCVLVWPPTSVAASEVSRDSLLPESRGLSGNDQHPKFQHVQA